MDKAARRLGINALEIRRRNLISADEFPYTGVTGIVYDPGSYRESLELCADSVAYETWPDRQRAARGDGRLVGLGFSCFSESTAYGTEAFAARKMLVSPGYENAEVRMDATGYVNVAVGTLSHGQGHETTFAQIVADELGLTPQMVRVIEGDTDITPYGWGTFASRSLVIGGSAARRAAAALAKRLRRIGAHMLEVDPEDLELRDGRLAVRGSPDRSVGVPEVAKLAYRAAHMLPTGEEPRLVENATCDPPTPTFANASHCAVVDVDIETGRVNVDRYVVVEDCGTVINPMIVDGQVRGGVAQGIAAALYEQLVYDDAGQILTGTLMDYLVPTAGEIPRVEIHHLETRCAYSDLGAKGMGEGGTVGAVAAVANAVNDALAQLGVEIDSLPITSEKVLAAIQSATGPNVSEV